MSHVAYMNAQQQQQQLQRNWNVPPGSVASTPLLHHPHYYVSVCCSVLQFVAVCSSVLQCVAVRYSMLQCVAVCCSVLRALNLNPSFVFAC